jgi:hypothetical protein
MHVCVYICICAAHHDAAASRAQTAMNDASTSLKVCAHTLVWMYICTCTHTCMYLCVCIYVCTYLCGRNHAQSVYIYIYMYIYIYIIYMYACVFIDVWHFAIGGLQDPNFLPVCMRNCVCLCWI